MSFTVHGRPVPQGSLRSLGKGRPTISDNKAVLQPWRDSIAWHARQAAGPASWDGPLHVDLTFVFVRPAAHYGTGRNARVLKPSAPAFPATRGQGDVDKLARAVLDALTASGVFVDDSQVSSLAARKVWTGPVFDRPCLRVELGPLLTT